ncbi:MAG: beta-hydroxyacyl-ACP dehydratase [Planctomycetes bacterium]|nr:beta-hydroxyacyl-ACP dehydratase [Planctomycetota bacterium]
MPPQLLIDESTFDVNKVVMPIEEIRKYNAQRHEMEQLSGVLRFDPDAGEIVCFKDLGDGEFWIRGHIPGRPLMPGVIMIEAAAQMCSLYFGLVSPSDKFIGFGGVDDVKFRGQVVPGDKLILLGKLVELRPRRAIFDTQGVVDGKMVFQARITGMPI